MPAALIAPRTGSVNVAFAFTSHSVIGAFVTLFVWGCLGFAVVPLLPMRIVNEAAAAPNLAATLNQSTFNLGNASGAWIGGSAIAAGIGYDALPWLGAAGVLLAFIGTVVSASLAPAVRPFVTKTTHEFFCIRYGDERRERGDRGRNGRCR